MSADNVGTPPTQSIANHRVSSHDTDRRAEVAGAPTTRHDTKRFSRAPRTDGGHRSAPSLVVRIPDRWSKDRRPSLRRGPAPSIAEASPRVANVFAAAFGAESSYDPTAGSLDVRVVNHASSKSLPAATERGRSSRPTVLCLLRSSAARTLAAHGWWCLLVLLTCGCYAPLHSPGVKASALPDIFRTPTRTLGPPLNFSALTREPVTDYLLGPDDILDVTVPALFDRSEVAPLRVQVMGNGEIQLPLVGAVKVAGLNLQQVQLKINQAYQNGFIVEPKISVTLVQKATVSVLVLGQVQVPGVYPLNKNENDVGHALGAAQGLTDEAGDYIEVHKRSLGPRLMPHGVTRLPAPEGFCQPPLPSGNMLEGHASQPAIIRLPMRGPQTYAVQPSDVILETGDVVVVPNRRNEVFFVVGLLSQTNTVRFTVGDRERELGVGFILPRDREIDVVTAVAMAGYIDPIDSPTTVTVQRQMPDGKPLLIHVDLIKARFDPRETVLVAPGDIIYLNPDGFWYFRRVFDRIVADLIILPYDGLVR